MVLPRNSYVPSLRWRQGESLALVDLTPEVKDRIVPLITLPNVEFDFESNKPVHTVQEHVDIFTRRYRTKWNARRAWLSVDASIADERLDSGSTVLKHVFASVLGFGSQVVPVVSLGKVPSDVGGLVRIVRHNQRGMAICIGLEHLAQQNTHRIVDDVRKTVCVERHETDLIIDLAAPNFTPYEAFADLLISKLHGLVGLEDYRNLVVVSSAIPESFGRIKKGRDEIPRHDWRFYKVLIGRIPQEMRHPVYGDYGIVHPEFKVGDMRFIKPPGKLVYTTRDSWIVFKGGSFRDDSSQMHDHCRNLVDSGYFSGAGYSKGDEYIAECGAGDVGPSNQMRWKRVGINHHMTQVANDLAKLAAES